MCDGVEVEVWMHGRQGCLVGCVRTEPSTEKGVLTCQTQPDVAPEYRTHWTHRRQCPHYESQDATLPYLMQNGFLLISHPPNTTTSEVIATTKPTFWETSHANTMLTAPTTPLARTTTADANNTWVTSVTIGPTLPSNRSHQRNTMTSGNWSR